jgi:hypothetical protein
MPRGVRSLGRPYSRGGPCSPTCERGKVCYHALFLSGPLSSCSCPIPWRCPSRFPGCDEVRHSPHIHWRCLSHLGGCRRVCPPHTSPGHACARRLYSSLSPGTSTVPCCPATLPPGRPPNHCVRPATNLCPFAGHAHICLGQPLALPSTPQKNLSRKSAAPLLPGLERPRSLSGFASHLPADSLLHPWNTISDPTCSFSCQKGTCGFGGTPIRFSRECPAFLLTFSEAGTPFPGLSRWARFDSFPPSRTLASRKGTGVVPSSGASLAASGRCRSSSGRVMIAASGGACPSSVTEVGADARGSGCGGRTGRARARDPYWLACPCALIFCRHKAMKLRGDRQRAGLRLRSCNDGDRGMSWGRWDAISVALKSTTRNAAGLWKEGTG